MPDRIIHFAQDEKFINSAHLQFEAVCPGKNEFLIVSQATDFKYVTPKPGMVKVSAEEAVARAKTIGKNDLVVFHSLAEVFFPIALAVKKKVPKVWFCFGYEIYNDRHFYSENTSFDRLTRVRFGVSDLPLSVKVKEFVHRILRKLNPRTPLSVIETKRKAISRMDYLCSSFAEEQAAIQKLIKQTKKPFSFWYYPIENMVDVNREPATEKPDILVGNSGHATGNHLDVFEKIKAYDFTGRKIVVPLSYGNRSYIDAILPDGKAMLGSHFHPLTEFYALEDYNKILDRCGVAILNCRRQQALGNTIALIWLGSKVFLSEKNPFFHYLRRICVTVFSYESDLNETSCNVLLTADEIRQNRKALREHLNAELLHAELKADIQSIP